ncbi:hypothetical protein HOL34_00010 [bacterium]|jgi:hypothetical protein|nr:hypothetical protein [bacterium]MBT4577974.1 hypothetical protein [bacterium]MBT5345994.1 hypothetical protein [bacterium]MBT6130780.1 hypothetical protein [bacterium]MBT6528484.1 hypothetical protein [bacterium]
MKTAARTIRALLLVSFLLPVGLLKAVQGSDSYNSFSDYYSCKICLVLPDGSDIAPAVMVLERACRGLEIPEAVSELFECVKRGKHMIEMEVLLDAIDGCQELLQNHHDCIEDDAVLRIVSDNLNAYSRSLLGSRWHINTTSDISIATIADNENITIYPHGTGTLALGSPGNTAFTATSTAITLTSGDALTLTDGTASFVLGGTGTTTLSSATTIDLDCTGAMSLNSTSGAINVGNDADAQAINIGTGAANRTITIGNTNGTTQVALKSGSGGVTFTGALAPASADGAALGSASLEWSDLFLADGGIVYFGSDQEITLTHVADRGLILKHAASGSNTPVYLTLQSNEAIIDASDKIGVIDFQAIGETGADAVLVSAGIEAVAEATFDATNNPTKLSFKTAASEAAAEKMKLSSIGVLTLNGGSGAIVIPDGGTIGSATTSAAITIASDGIVTFVDDIKIKDSGTIGSTSAATAIAIALDGIVTFVDDIKIKDGGTIGSMTTPAAITIASDGIVTFSDGITFTGALAPASADSAALGSASLEWSDLYLADGGVIYFGNDQEVELAHNADKGLILKHAATGAAKPVSLTLQSDEAIVAVNDKIGVVDFQAIGETGADAVLVAAGIEAVAEATFGATNNPTKLSFKTAASEAAAEKMSLSSTGVLTLNGSSGAIVIPDGGTIGSATTSAAITIASDGIATFIDDIKIKDGGTIGSASADTAMTIASDGVVTFVDDIVMGSDNSVIRFGADSEVHLVHDPDKGLIIKHTASGDDSPAYLGFYSGESDIRVDDKIGIIDFYTPAETLGEHDVAAIEAVAESRHTGSDHATKLSFKTAAGATHSTEKMALSSVGVLTLNGGSGSIVIPDAGTIGSASATSSITIASDGIVAFVDDIKIKDGGTIGSANAATAMTIASDGVVTFVDDIVLGSDNSVIRFGADSEVRLIHDPDKGLIIKHTASGDDSPAYLGFYSGESDIRVDDKIGIIDFYTPAESLGEHDVAAIEAVAESRHTGSDHATKLSFKTAVGATHSTEKMALSSVGVLTLNGASGYVRATDGTISTPAYSFTNGVDVGMWYDSGDDELEVSNTSGGVKLTNGATAWAASSDKRLKRDIEPSNLGLEFINDLNTVSYHLIAGEGDKQRYGLIGQELDEVAMRHGHPDFAVNRPNSELGYYSICYAELVTPLIKAVQELSNDNEDMKERYEGVQARFEDMQAQIDDLRKELKKDKKDK